MKDVVPSQEVQIWSTHRERDILVRLKSRPLLTGSVKTERLEVQIASVCCDVEYTKREFRCATWYAKRNVSMFGMPIFGSYVRVEICLDSTKNELVYDELVVRTTPERVLAWMCYQSARRSASKVGFKTLLGVEVSLYDSRPLIQDVKVRAYFNSGST